MEILWLSIFFILMGSIMIIILLSLIDKTKSRCKDCLKYKRKECDIYKQGGDCCLNSKSTNGMIKTKKIETK